MYKKLCKVAWEDFRKLSFKDKSAFLVRKEDGAPYHTLYAQQFDYEMIDRLVNLSNCIRKTAKGRDGAIFLRSLLSHKRAMLYFSQPSSRTFLSFFSACQILGLQIGEVRDTSTSSEFKGEAQEDSIRTFSSGPSTNSMIRNRVPSTSSKPYTDATLACWRLARARASR